jgi:hypothetical protein
LAKKRSHALDHDACGRIGSTSRRVRYDCAPARSGHAAAPPSPAMKSRRRIFGPQALSSGEPTAIRFPLEPIYRFRPSGSCREQPLLGGKRECRASSSTPASVKGFG